MKTLRGRQVMRFKCIVCGKVTNQHGAQKGCECGSFRFDGFYKRIWWWQKLWKKMKHVTLRRAI